MGKASRRRLRNTPGIGLRKGHLRGPMKALGLDGLDTKQLQFQQQRQQQQQQEQQQQQQQPQSSSYTSATFARALSVRADTAKSRVQPARGTRILSALNTCRSSLSETSAEDIIPEIIVQTDGMELMDVQESNSASPPHGNASPFPEAETQPISKHLLPAMSEQIRSSLASSLSALSDQSELSSAPSSVSSKATTPVDHDGLKEQDYQSQSQSQSQPPPPPAAAAAVPLTSSSQEAIGELSQTAQEPQVEADQDGEAMEHPKANQMTETAEIAQTTAQTSRLTESAELQPKTDNQRSQPQPRPQKTKIKIGPRRRYDVRPKVSIPTDLSPHQHAVQCIAAAESSRLSPYALHQDEYLILRDHVSHAQITTYLNIRNGILRLWVRNPTVAVSREEGIGCAKDSRWFDVANLCYDWLAREGYINFGCVSFCSSLKLHASSGEGQSNAKRKTIVVIGAGLSGLGCARQLTGLFTQYSEGFRERGELPPRIIVLEGRDRVGGRVYSRAFRTKPVLEPYTFRGKRYTAEMGGMIITGFERGNPINILLRGQLGLAYHALRSDTTIFDSNGKPVDHVRDLLVEKLFNHALERVSEYKFKPAPSKLIEGNREMIDDGKDSSAEVHKTIAYVEDTTAAQPHAPPVSEQNMAPPVDLVPISSDRVTGRSHVEPGTMGSLKAAYKAKLMGWPLKNDVSEEKDIDLDGASKAEGTNLGAVMDAAIMQYQEIVDLNSQDMRLINWHIANLEYSNATNYSQLSLTGWDIDAGYEFEGKHSMVVGGYQSVANGLAQFPSPLDIQYKKEVKAIRSSAAPASALASSGGGLNGAGQAGNLYRIECEDGTSFEADYIVNTMPLGVLKHGNVEFDPPLPDWKSEAIGRLGFGVLNKVILLYSEPFWDEDRDIFGVLCQPGIRASLNPGDYASRRGRFFQWFNVSNTSGMPVLIALMAGDAGFDVEKTPNDELIEEATEVLRSVFGRQVPMPVEAIVTRWASDRFARGSYSSAAPEMRMDDYDLMSRPVGEATHFFAGEHTTGTHPATVHGAYLSGLRAASEVLQALLGPIEVPDPLIMPKDGHPPTLKRKASDLWWGAEPPPKDPREARERAYEEKVRRHIVSELGEYPPYPKKTAQNPYQLFCRVSQEAARRRCEEGRRPGKGPPNPNEVRMMLSKMWGSAGEEGKRPFYEQVALQKEAYARELDAWKGTAAEYDAKAAELRETYVRENPNVPGPEDLVAEAVALAEAAAAAAEAAAAAAAAGGAAASSSASFLSVSGMGVQGGLGSGSGLGSILGSRSGSAASGGRRVRRVVSSYAEDDDGSDVEMLG